MSIRRFRLNVVAPSVAPEWALNLSTVGQWVTINTNTVQSVAPGNKAGDTFTGAEITGLGGHPGHFSYSGGVLASNYGAHGALLTYGGGHAIYFGNEVYSFDLATGTWDRLTDPFVGAVVGAGFAYTSDWQTDGTAANTLLVAADGMYPNNSPGVPHTYDQMVYVPSVRKLFIPKAQTGKGNITGRPGQAKCLFSFSLDTLTWTKEIGPHADGQIASNGWSLYDPSTDRAVVQGGETIASPKCHVYSSMSTTPTRALLTKPTQGLNDSAGAYSLSHGMIVLTGSVMKLYRLSIGATAVTATELSSSGTTPPTSTYGGFEWAPNLNAFVYFPYVGGQLYRVGISGDTATWTMLPSSGVSIEDSARVGMYARANIVTYGSTDYAVVVKSTTGPVYAARLN